jgi:predicted regulator of Ras-like GTPase activity (Roadblock/LC7/MglB family)
MYQTQIDEIFSLSPFIEAAIQVSKEGLPLAWRCQSDASVEEIASIAAGLFSLGFELELLPKKQSAQLLIDTDHGTMLVRAMPNDALLIIMMARECSLQDIELKLDNNIFNQNPYLKEAHYGKNGQGSSL